MNKRYEIGLRNIEKEIEYYKQKIRETRDPYKRQFLRNKLAKAYITKQLYEDRIFNER